MAGLDFGLRADGHRRNPGTTAEVGAAALFVGLREGWLGRTALHPGPRFRARERGASGEAGRIMGPTGIRHPWEA